MLKFRRFRRMALVSLGTVILAGILTGCRGKASCTYDLDNGDRVTVTFDQKDVYRFVEEDPFLVVKADESAEGQDNTAARGVFITTQMAEEYRKVAEEDSGAVFFADGTTSYGAPYFAFSYKEAFSYVIHIPKSESAVLVTSDHSAEEAKAVFDRLTVKYVGKFEKKSVEEKTDVTKSE